MVEYVRTSGEWKITVIKDSIKHIYQSKNSHASRQIEKNIVDFFNKNMNKEEITSEEKNIYISKIEELIRNIYEEENS